MNVNIWAPSWRWTAGIAVAMLAVIFLLGSAGINPNRVLGAAAAGGCLALLGFGVGALIWFGLSRLVGKDRLPRFRGWLIGGGGFAGYLLSKGIPTFGAAAEKELLGMVLIGAVIGALCGLIPQLSLKRKQPRFGNLSYWLSALAGAIGGGLLALPAAGLLTLGGYLYSRKTSPEPTMADIGAEPKSG